MGVLGVVVRPNWGSVAYVLVSYITVAATVVVVVVAGGAVAVAPDIKYAVEMVLGKAISPKTLPAQLTMHSCDATPLKGGAAADQGSLLCNRLLVCTTVISNVVTEQNGSRAYNYKRVVLLHCVH